MGKGLEGKTIVIAGSRKTEEMSTLVEKQGGTAIVRPLQGTVFLAEEQVEPDVRNLVEKGSDWFIFTTGIGTETLLNVAKKNDLEEPFIQMLREGKVASRGYKTFGVLKKLGIKPVAVDEDGTTEGLLRALKDIDFNNQRIAIQLHGETAPRLTQYLEQKGATVTTILPYQHIPPEQTTVDLLLEEIFAKKVDAICFTTAIQVRSLFTHATEKRLDNRLREVFRESVLPVAVGKVTAEALREEGLDNYLAPELERMGSMILEVSKYYEQRK